MPYNANCKEVMVGEVMTCPENPYGDKYVCFSLSVPTYVGNMKYRGCTNYYYMDAKIGECTERNQIEICLCDQDKCNYM